MNGRTNGHRVKIKGTGSYLPGEAVRFDDIDKILGTIEEAPAQIKKWMDQIRPVMRELSGVQKFYYAIDPLTRKFSDTNITMSVHAANAALATAGMKPGDIDLLIYASSCLEQMPTTSVRIQQELGIESVAEMSIHANCTSTYKALMLAHDLISIGRYKTAMVVSSNMASSQLRAEYYNQKLVTRDQVFLRWFLSDGAGCMIFSRDDDPTPSGSFIEASFIESIGYGHIPIMYDNRESYSMNPLEVYEKGLHHITQKKVTMFEGENQDNVIAGAFVDGLQRMAGLYDIDLSKTGYFQINFPAQHVFDLIREKCAGLGIPENAYYTKLKDFGYAGPPMVLICMDKLFREEKLAPGDQIISFVTEVSKIMQAGFMIKCY